MKMDFYKLLMIACISGFAMSASATKGVDTSSPGGGSDGGGNSYKGRPLESYAKDPHALSAYKYFILPLRQNIKSKQSQGRNLDVLESLIESVFSQKIWYFVPGPLDQIPGDLLNSAVRTDQAALQGFDRVWIDEDIWNSMTLRDQALLILHETIMGLKILKFGTDFRQCLAGYNNSPVACTDHGPAVDNPIILKAADYVDVQKLTLMISQHFQEMTSHDWNKAFGEFHISFYLDWFEEPKPMTLKELDTVLKQSALSGYLPNQGYNLRTFDTENHPPMRTPEDIDKYFQKNKEVCAVSANLEGQNLHLSISSKSDPLSLVIPLPQTIETTYRDMFNEKRSLRQVPIGFTDSKPRANGGFTLYNAWLGFDHFRLAHVYVQEMVCSTKDCSSPSLDVKGGYLYICADNPRLFKPSRNP